MLILDNRAGVSKLKVLIVLAILGLGVSEGIKYLAVQLDYQKMKDTMETKASVAQVLQDDEILKDLVSRAAELDLPLERENFVVVRDQSRKVITISTAWEAEVQYLWGLCGDPCTQIYSFEPSVQASYSR